MPQPIEFTIQDHRFRHTPLACVPLTQEYNNILVRLDHESGALNTLAFTFENADFDEILSMGPAGVMKLVKLLSMLACADQPIAVLEDTGDSEDATPKPRDTLPRTLDALCLYYARVGSIEHCVQSNGEDMWLSLQTADAFNKHPFQLALVACAGYVLGGLFVPFVSLFHGLSEKVKALASSLTTSRSEEESTEPTAPTSES